MKNITSFNQALKVSLFSHKQTCTILCGAFFFLQEVMQNKNNLIVFLQHQHQQHREGRRQRHQQDRRLGTDEEAPTDSQEIC